VQGPAPDEAGAFAGQRADVVADGDRALPGAVAGEDAHAGPPVAVSEDRTEMRAEDELHAE
jgi:hypothetical protein